MSWSETVRRVRDRCEICRMHQALQGATFHVDHVVPRSRGGSDEEDNLALCCPTCNLHKSDRTELPDPDSSGVVPLFHPRRDHWADHFRWDGYRVVGLTGVGRATVFAFDLNHPRRLLIREAEERFDFFPPVTLPSRSSRVVGWPGGCPLVGGQRLLAELEGVGVAARDV